MYFVAGVTGHVGSVVAEQLIAAGKQVRVLVRSAEKGAPWKARGADVAVGELGDGAALERALTGIEAAFLLLPPPLPPPATAADVYAFQRKLGDTIASAVKGAAVPRVVLLSSIAAQHSEGNGPVKGLHHLEKGLRASGTRLTSVRPCYFMENLAGMLGAATGMGIYPSTAPAGGTMHMVATVDIGKVAARALLDPPAGGAGVIELAGPADVRADEVAAALAKALGKPINVVTIPPEGFLQAFTQAGLPPAFAEMYAEMSKGFHNGIMAFERPASIVRGTTPLQHVVDGLVTSQARA